MHGKQFIFCSVGDVQLFVLKTIRGNWVQWLYLIPEDQIIIVAYLLYLVWNKYYYV